MFMPQHNPPYYRSDVSEINNALFNHTVKSVETGKRASSALRDKYIKRDNFDILFTYKGKQYTALTLAICNERWDLARLFLKCDCSCIEKNYPLIKDCYGLVDFFLEKSGNNIISCFKEIERFFSAFDSNLIKENYKKYKKEDLDNAQFIDQLRQYAENQEKVSGKILQEYQTLKNLLEEVEKEYPLLGVQFKELIKGKLENFLEKDSLYCLAGKAILSKFFPSTPLPPIEVTSSCFKLTP